jgi:hypothetical protein
MENFNGTGKILLIAGLLIAAVGLWLMYGPKIPLLGKLPGDIVIRRENFSFYFPITTCIVLSILISLLMKLFK